MGQEQSLEERIADSEIMYRIDHSRDDYEQYEVTGQGRHAFVPSALFNAKVREIRSANPDITQDEIMEKISVWAAEYVEAPFVEPFNYNSYAKVYAHENDGFVIDQVDTSITSEYVLYKKNPAAYVVKREGVVLRKVPPTEIPLLQNLQIATFVLNSSERTGEVYGFGYAGHMTEQEVTDAIDKIENSTIDTIVEVVRTVCQNASANPPVEFVYRDWSEYVPKSRKSSLDGQMTMEALMKMMQESYPHDNDADNETDDRPNEHVETVKSSVTLIDEDEADEDVITIPAKCEGCGLRHEPNVD